MPDSKGWGAVAVACLLSSTSKHKRHQYMQSSPQHPSSFNKKHLCICVSRRTGHRTSWPGTPWYTTTESARYVAMMKSCSTTKAALFDFAMNRLMTLLTIIRCSASRYLQHVATHKVKHPIKLASLYHYKLRNSKLTKQNIMKETCTLKN